MIDLDKWQEVFFTLKQHKLRTTLTAFGVFWGIFMLVILLGVGSGFERGMMAGFGENTNSVYLWSSGRTQMPYRGLPIGRRLHLKDEDLLAIRQKIPELGLLSGINDLNGWQVDQYVVRNEKSGTFGVRGVEPSYFIMAGIQLVEGRVINDLDFRDRRKVAVIAPKVQDVLFEPDENPIGQSLKIGGVDFKIIGTVKPSALGGNADADLERIILPNSTQRATFNQMGWIGYLQFTPKEGIPASVVEKKVIALLKDRKGIHPEERGVIGRWNTQNQYDKVRGLYTAIRTFSWIVAIGTLIAGVIGVGNIMLIIVKERTREIGVRKALGATPGNIISTIVQEALVLTIFAGYLGLVAGVFTLEVITNVLASTPNTMFGKAEIDFTTASFAILALVIAGLLASILPASKAANIDPIVALQDE